jgi:glutamyl-Q tRNA(Asp) synthetase
VRLGYAWRGTDGGGPVGGLALRWWLQQLDSPATRKALLEGMPAPWSSGTPDASLGPAGAGYIGRFAPSPTGPLHAGSLVAAWRHGWMPARTTGVGWCASRTSTPRAACRAGHADPGPAGGVPPRSDETPVWQSQRGELYRNAIQRLMAADLAYPCGCSRREIELALSALGRSTSRNAEQVYPGTCREGLHGKAARAMRLRTLDAGRSRRAHHVDRPAARRDGAGRGT